jgi:5-methyltetrahydropteroyltriglutamate--homocysteine methyltransferase
MKTYAFGFPRIGANREFKKAVESFWKGTLTEAQLRAELAALQETSIATYKKYVDYFPVNEITPYDSMLDTAVMLGLYAPKNLKEYYELCRGAQALEMTKWFNTNYHYLVPDVTGRAKVTVALAHTQFKDALAKHPEGLPRLIGPFTFLKMAKGIAPAALPALLAEVAALYRDALRGVKEVHLDEPAFVLELSAAEIAAIKAAYATLAGSGCKLHVFAYYDNMDWLDELLALPVASLGLDFVHGRATYEAIKKRGFPNDKVLVAGVVDGRNIWRANPQKIAADLKALNIPTERLLVSNAGPLMHVPISTKNQGLAPELVARLAFAEEKLHELKLIAAACEGKAIEPWFVPSTYGANAAVQQRVQKLSARDFERTPAYPERVKAQAKALNLPLFPTTTIGSFPQTEDVRKARAAFTKGAMAQTQYDAFVDQKMRELVKYQEELDLDVLVHGEFERTDMVEFFCQRLDGIATTSNGWILSYGTRMYRPSIIFGDVARPRPMTVREAAYAQALTKRPMKGMLTGAVTIIAWDFVREDIPIEQVAWQLALALKDEIADLEKAGINVIQIDEPAFKEKAPIKKRAYAAYFDWAIKSFRLTASSAKPTTQIHSHMCYSEFGDIIAEIQAMDFDVISIEASRSRGDVIASFEKGKFDRQIGLGVWDIHSPAVPTVAQMNETAQRALKAIPKQNFWINPDCGLKTRGWDESTAALKNMVQCARALRGK